MSNLGQKDARMLERLATGWVKSASSQWALELVLSFFVLWLLVGPFMKFSSDWQMIMDTTSSAITLVMVFLLVRTQSKDTLVIQMKLNEVIAALQGANNQLINIENLSESAVQELSKRYETVATKLKHDDAISTESLATHEIVAEEEKQNKEEKQIEKDKLIEEEKDILAAMTLSSPAESHPPANSTDDEKSPDGQ